MDEQSLQLWWGNAGTTQFEQRTHKIMKKRGPKRAKMRAEVKAVKAVKNLPIPKKQKEKITKGLAEKVGSLIGSVAGPGGSFLGGLAGKAFGYITGMGEYHLRSNTLMNEGAQSQGPPVFGDTSTVRVKHREYIKDITSSVEFSVESFALNPGQTTFPWLSRVAAQYEQYRIRGLVFEFKSTSANAVGSTNTALGSVIMVTDHDALDPAFTTKRQMEAYEFSVAGNPADNIMHPVECAPERNVMTQMFVRSGSIPTGADRRLYDLGNFYIATVGMQAASTIGELWVSYDVELERPKLETPLGESLLGAHYKALPVSGTSWFTGATRQDGSNLAMTFVEDLEGTMYFPFEGRYYVTIHMASSGANNTAILPAVEPNYTALPTAMFFGQGTASAAQYVNTTTGGNITTSTFVVDVLIGSGGVAMGTGISFIGTGEMDIFVQQISSGLKVEPFRGVSAQGLNELLEEKFQIMLERARSEPEEKVALSQEMEQHFVALRRAIHAPKRDYSPKWVFLRKGLWYELNVGNICLVRDFTAQELSEVRRDVLPDEPEGFIQAIDAMLSRNARFYKRGQYDAGHYFTSNVPEVRLSQGMQ